MFARRSTTVLAPAICCTDLRAKLRHMKRLLCAASILFLISGCAGVRSATTLTPFSTFVDDYFTARFEFSPTSGTDVGLHQYDNKLDDLSRAALDRRTAELRGFLSRLDTVRQQELSFDDAIDAEVIEGQIRADLLDIETLRLYENNPMPYAGLPGSSIGALIKRDFAPAPDRLRSVIARLRLIPRIYDAARTNLNNPPKEFTDLAVRMSRGSAGYFEGLVAKWAEEAAGGDAALLDQFRVANRQVIDSTRSFSQWLEGDLLPRSKGSYAIGKANFLLKLKYEEAVEMPLEELLAVGEGQLGKDYEAFIAIARQIDATKSAAEVMDNLSKVHPTAEDLIPSARRTVEDARSFVVQQDIVTVPSEVRARVEETPPYARSGGFASMDTPGPYESKATEAFYYVTPVEQDWDEKHVEEHLRLFNPFVVAMINVHEAYPGHYLQFLYAPRFPTKTRKLIFSGTNAEGWAHYAEQMMVDEGFGGADLRYRLAQLQEALLRDVRYVVGIKLHTEGWSVEQGAQLFREKAFQEPANAYEEARRGAYNPTYLYYTLGKIQIFELRDEFMKRNNASKKAFHDAFVSQGGLPIKFVRQILFRRN